MNREFRFEAPISIRWGDMDAMGHVNNTRFIGYFEEGRIKFFQALAIGVDITADLTEGPILAAIECQFRQQLEWPAEILVGTRVIEIGNRSFKVEHRIRTKDSEEIAATGVGAIVWFDYAAQKPKPLPETLVEQLKQWM
ncbi:MAG: thioesterase family protein [Acidobacteriota bacterium]|nr:thioesterase family protein [Acidobacteriota bacterium]